MDRIGQFLVRFQRERPTLYRVAMSNWTLLGLGLVVVMTGYYSGLYR